MSDRSRILVLNGPNLDILGRRDPAQYGTVTLADLESIVLAAAAETVLDVDFRQTNREGELVEWLHEALDDFDAVVINPAAYAHTSVALHDAVEALTVPVVEVHLSNTWKREPFRHVDHVATAATAVFAGAGADGYRLAVLHVAGLLAGRAPGLPSGAADHLPGRSQPESGTAPSGTAPGGSGTTTAL